jgi:hypothetical protein
VMHDARDDITDECINPMSNPSESGFSLGEMPTTHALNRSCFPANRQSGDLARRSFHKLEDFYATLGRKPLNLRQIILITNPFDLLLSPFECWSYEPGNDGAIHTPPWLPSGW